MPYFDHPKTEKKRPAYKNALPCDGDAGSLWAFVVRVARYISMHILARELTA
jgi:hypothetical protein